MTDTPHHLERAWRTVDFKPALPGWRALYLDTDERLVLPVVGWLIQESYYLDLVSSEAHVDDYSPERRVIPGTCAEPYGWEVEPVDRGAEFMWKLLAPGEPEPSEEEEQAERARRADERKRGA